MSLKYLYIPEHRNIYFTMLPNAQEVEWDGLGVERLC